MVAKEVGVMGSTDWSARGEWAAAHCLGPDFSLGAILSGFQGMWPVGSAILDLELKHN